MERRGLFKALLGLPAFLFTSRAEAATGRDNYKILSSKPRLTKEEFDAEIASQIASIDNLGRCCPHCKHTLEISEVLSLANSGTNVFFVRAVAKTVSGSLVEMLVDSRMFSPRLMVLMDR